MQEKFTIKFEEKGNPEILGLPFAQMKMAVLGKDFELGLIFTTKEKIKELNKIYRNKNKATDILSFPISDDKGDIFINLEMAKRESVKFNRDLTNFVAFLFIHGLVHLKGFDHSDKMEETEKEYRKKFSI